MNMKNKITFVFLFPVVFVLHSSVALAYDAIYPGSILNPLQVQIVPQPGARLDELQRQTQLQAILLQQQALERQLLQQQIDSRLPSNVRTNNPVTCQSGYVQKGDGCYTYDQLCNLSYSNSVFQKFQTDGRNFVCSCKSGYVWNDQKTSCVIAPVAPVVPVKSNDQVCQQSSGVNSFYSGETNASKGGSIGGCSCKLGFQFEHGDYGQCVAILFETSQTNDQVCINRFGVNSIWTGTLNTQYSPICECRTDYKWDQGQTQCIFAPKTEVGAVTPVNKTEPEIKNIQSEKEIFPNNNKDELSVPINSDKEVVASVEVVKPKSFWNRFLSWFGF